ncbi:hypothetical protein GF374_01270, partial [Candidatus Woesearchaeota archaeon]|nr:hypothetical protein [Candidatus Woesearchaeota archaeon]
YEKIGNKLLHKYGLLYPVFIEVSKTSGEPLEKAGIDKKLTEKLTKLIQNRIKPPKAEIEGLIIMSSNEANGLKVIKSVIEKAEKITKKEKSKLKIQYLGAPKYKFKIISDDYKTAEKILEKIGEQLDEFMKKHDGSFKISRD